MTVELSVVVPVHNEAENVEPLAAEVATALADGPPYELIFVDDGSDDDTPVRLAALAAGASAVRTVRHRVRAGQSAAIVTGVRAASAPWVATLDGDGQNDPADLPRLWAELRAAPPTARLGLVNGHRRLRRDSLSKRLSSRIANAVRARALGDRTPDTGCGLKVFRRDAFLALPHFDHMHRFLPALFLRAGWNLRSVDVRHRPRQRGRSHYGMWQRLRVGIVDLLGVAWLQRRALRPDVED